MTSGIGLVFKNKFMTQKSTGNQKSAVFCQVVLDTSRRLEVDLGSLWYEVGSVWHTKVTSTSKYIYILI